MLDYYLGSMGFSYKGWRGVFYPEDLPARSYLAHYSQYFNAVEIDSTFYGIPRPTSVKRWASITAPDFRFCLKTPREITHERRLALDDGAGQLMHQFLDVAGLLEDRLGAILIQLPPTFTVDYLDSLATFLQALPTGYRYAVELRDPSWHNDQTSPLMRQHGVAWVALDYLDLPRVIHNTADFLYVRWIGQHGRFPAQNRELIDVTPKLQWWWDQLRPQLSQVDTLFGFFNDEYAGHSPATCNRFKAIAGLPVQELAIPRQASLF
jgi:uncharacterized protein YecE (DUF72 family)